MKIDQHISDLLFDHDCVIVPEMGGFLGSYAPASIHPVQHTLSPPSKKIAFNVFLKHNDGLLANYISQREHLSYTEALKEIKQYVEKYYHELEAGEKFMIERVGILYMDAERHIQFEAFKKVNYLKTSFGFSAIQCLPVTGEAVSEKKEFVKSRPSIRLAPNSYIKGKRVKMVNALLLIGSILWFGLNVYFVSPSKISFASLNLFDTVRHKEPVNIEPTVSNTPQPAPAHVETTDSKLSQPLEKKDTTAQSSPVISSPVTPPENNIAQHSENNYFLVGGAFRSSENATKMTEDLKGRGFANATIVESNNGFKLVCYDGFKNLDEAIAALNQLKAEQKEGWVYTRK